MGSAWAAVRWRDRAADLTAYLEAQGVLTDRAWKAGLQEVPRHLFVPDRAWASPQEWTGQPRPIDRRAASTDWYNAVYSNTSIITQRDEGATPATDPSGTPTCSLSGPHIAMEYLHLLDIADHHRVLEIGTGTGWTAAMLTWRVGGEDVVTVEVDKELAETAEANFDRAGLWPTVITGDGADGHPPRAPYDRVHVTCGVHTIPVAWLAQTRPGGVIVAPWMPVGGAYGHQLVLRVLGSEHAVGRFVGGGGFMMLRSQRTVPGLAAPPGVARHSVTRMDPRLIAEADGGAQLAIATLTPGLTVDISTVRDGDGWAYVATLTAGDSVATCTAPDDADEYEVVQHGDRRLWEEAEEAYRWWLRRGTPRRERFGLSIIDGAQRVWLDEPWNVLDQAVLPAR